MHSVNEDDEELAAALEFKTRKGRNRGVRVGKEKSVIKIVDLETGGDMASILSST